MCDKKRTRAEAFAADVLHGERERREASKAICRAILSRIDPAGTILCFMPLRDEVDILPVFDVVFENGGRVVLPYCIDRERMTLRLYQKDGELVRDAMKILSPKQDDPIDPAEIDAALIPAVALSADGRRLGRGCGFYDRFLPKLRADALLIGVCFPWRIREDLPTLAHDFSLQFVAAAGDLRVKNGEQARLL